jgi:hypothetical protein
MTSQSIFKGSFTNPLKNDTMVSTKKPFLGKLQPVTSRLPAKPMVDYEKGGSDFRCPHNTSCLGKQVLSGSQRRSQGRVTFTQSDRFGNSSSEGPGPASFGQSSSMRKQVSSKRRSAECTNFGTSSRDGALKLYAIYTCTKN